MHVFVYILLGYFDGVQSVFGHPVRTETRVVLGDVKPVLGKEKEDVGDGLTEVGNCVIEL